MNLLHPSDLFHQAKNLMSWSLGFNNIESVREIKNGTYRFQTVRPSLFDKTKQVGTEAVHASLKVATTVGVLRAPLIYSGIMSPATPGSLMEKCDSLAVLPITVLNAAKSTVFKGLKFAYYIAKNSNTYSRELAIAGKGISAMGTVASGLKVIGISTRILEKMHEDVTFKRVMPLEDRVKSVAKGAMDLAFIAAPVYLSAKNPSFIGSLTLSAAPFVFENTGRTKTNHYKTVIALIAAGYVIPEIMDFVSPIFASIFAEHKNVRPDFEGCWKDVWGKDILMCPA